MSVTISVQGNQEFVRANCPERIVVEVYPAEGNLPECRIEEFPFEKNVGNSTFRTVMSALGIDSGEYLCGECAGLTLRTAVFGMISGLGQKSGSEERGEGGCTMIHMGISQDREARILKSLKEIADEAISRKQKVVWG